MIAYDKDGVSLFYIDAQGQRVTAGYTDTERYSTMLMYKDEQKQAEQENATTLLSYNQALSRVQGPLDAGQGAANPTAPLKPLQKVVSDTGAVTYVPFVPPLADLKFPVTTPSTGLIAVPTPDKQAIMYNQVDAMFRKMFPDA